MSVTIPRAEIQAITERHGDAWISDHDPSGDAVRADASNRRYLADAHSETDGDRSALRAEADDLDALVDRIEREAARPRPAVLMTDATA